MRKFSALWVIVLIMLLAPGYAIGQVTFNLQHPATVGVGNYITVDVNVVAPGIDPPSLCGWQYTIEFDNTKLQLINVASSGFFSVSDLPGPIFDCSLGVCQEHNNPPNRFSGTDLTLTTPHLTPIFPPGASTAKYTFQALQAGTATFSLATSPTSILNGVSNCTDYAFLPITTLGNPTISVRDYPVPTLSTYGTIIFMLLLVASAVIFMRRRQSQV